MRLDARIQPEHLFSWYVWSCEECRSMPAVVWADDVTAQYGQIVGARLVDRKARVIVVTRQARAIRFLFETRTVLINPLDDATMIESEVEESRHADAAS